MSALTGAIEIAKGALAAWIVFAVAFAGWKLSTIYRIASATLDFLALRQESRRDAQANIALVARRERR